MKDNNYGHWALCLVIMLASACDLSRTDPSNITTGNFFETESQAEAQVNSIYSSLYPMQQEQAWLIWELRTGASNSEFTADFGFPSFERVRNLAMSSDFPSVRVLWDSHYRGIANANLALSRIPDMDISDGAKSSLLGQARFLRAYYYFNLVRTFRNIPLVTEPVELGDDDLMPEQTPTEEVYALIVDDLKSAEGSSLPFNSTSGRVTLGAAKALLAEVYLTMAGAPLNRGEEYYELAYNKAKEVIDSGEYRLFDSYEAFRNPSRDNTGEYIFQIQYLVNEIENNNLQEGILPFDRDISAYSAEIGFAWVQEEFIESYLNGDKRIQEKEFYYTSFSSELNRDETVNFDNYMPFKFFNMEAHLNNAQSGLNWQIIRYADVLLDFAEASNEVLGPTQAAYDAINKIRSRADIPELSGLSKEEFRKAVWRERWHETQYEGELWFDMIRTRTAYDFSNNRFNNYVGHSFVDGKTLEEKHLFFPIPVNEIRNNDNLEQNPGY